MKGNIVTESFSHLVLLPDVCDTDLCLHCQLLPHPRPDVCDVLEGWSSAMAGRVVLLWISHADCHFEGPGEALTHWVRFGCQSTAGTKWVGNTSYQKCPQWLDPAPFRVQMECDESTLLLELFAEYATDSDAAPIPVSAPQPELVPASLC